MGLGPSREILEEVVDVVLSFGPRAAGSPGEVQTADYVVKEFEKAGLRVDRQVFPISNIPLIVLSKLLPALSVAVLGLVLWQFSSRPVLALILLAAPLALMGLMLWKGFGVFRLFELWPTGTAANLIGRSDGEDPAKPTVVLVAHYDTKSQTQTLALRSLCVMIGLIGYLVLLGLLGLRVLSGLWIGDWIFGILAVLVLADQAFYLVNRNANYSPGAVDNLSGLAVVLALARRLIPSLKGKVNLIVLASAAEELGLVGAVQFLRQFGSRLDRERTWIVNFDCLGPDGQVRMFGSKAARNSLQVDRARMIFEEEGFGFRFSSVMIGAGMDHIPFSRAGFRAVSITRASFHTASKIHSTADGREALDLDQLTILEAAAAKWIERELANHDGGK